jgi:hypothetical protein
MGGDVPTSERRYWNLVKGKLQDFANQEGLNIHFVKTNASALINEELMTRHELRTEPHEYRAQVSCNHYSRFITILIINRSNWLYSPRMVKRVYAVWIKARASEGPSSAC